MSTTGAPAADDGHAAAPHAHQDHKNGRPGISSLERPSSQNSVDVADMTMSSPTKPSWTAPSAGGNDDRPQEEMDDERDERYRYHARRAVDFILDVGVPAVACLALAIGFLYWRKATGRSQ